MVWWSKPGGAAAVVAALAIVAFARSLGNEFTYDEGLVIGRAQHFLQSTSFGTLFSPQYFAASQEGTWRPVCTLTYMLDAAISMHPAMFKLQSLVWHIGAAWLLMALARRRLLCRPEPIRRYAVVAGLFFVLHPVTTETVDNASFREDTLVTFFTLATLLLALDRHPFWSLFTFALGLLSKESAVVAPALLGLIRLMRLGGDPPPPRPAIKALAGELAPYAVLAVVYLAIRFGPMAIPIEYATYPGDTFIGTLAGLPAIWAHDIRLVLLPWPLCADYTGFFRFGRQPIGPVAGALAIVLAYVALLVWAARRGPRVLAFGLGWFLIALLPVSNLMPIPIPAAERFLYLPLAGIAIAVAAGFGSAGGQTGAARAPARAPAVPGRWGDGAGGVCRDDQRPPRRLAGRSDSVARDRRHEPPLVRRPERRGRGLARSRAWRRARPTCCARRRRARSWRCRCAPNAATSTGPRSAIRAWARRGCCWARSRPGAPRWKGRRCCSRVMRCRSHGSATSPSSKGTWTRRRAC